MTLDLFIVAASDAYLRVTGARRDELLDRHIVDVVQDDPDEPSAAARRLLLSLERVIQTREPDEMALQRYEVRRPNTDEGAVEARWFSLANWPVVAPSGELVYIIHRIEDVTDLVRLKESEARSARDGEAAREAHRRKDEFLAMLGHELRNPLAPILMAIELMRLRGGDTLSRERNIIERQVRHVVRLIEDLLDVARIAQGKVQLKREQIELWQAISRAIELALPVIQEREHALHISVPHEGLPVEADLVRLSQIVTNLLVNAAKYTEPGGRIELSAERRAGLIKLRVRDTGVGISPEALPRLFELFAQAERSLDRAQGGLGIGLAIVRSLVELHGGSISAHSDGPGEGSEFVVTLPALAGPVGVHADGPPSPAPGRPSGAPLAGRIRVLIVDDNRDAATTLADALEELGYAARVAHDGPSALAEEALFLPKVALLDIGLPVMDGYELARRLRQLRGSAGIRLVALSGYGQAHDLLLSRATGFDEHLIKPLDLGALRATLDRLTRTAAA